MIFKQERMDSSERHLALKYAPSCLSCVAFKGDYFISVVRNYKMQTENRYSYLINVKFLTPFVIFEILQGQSRNVIYNRLS